MSKGESKLPADRLFFAGIDVGSVATKVAVLQGEEVLFAESAPTAGTGKKVATRLYDKALGACAITTDDISYTVSTGYGRRMIKQANKTVTEITANASGARWTACRLCPDSKGSPVRTVIDIGGQDSKVIALDEAGRMADFTMNDKCAAGTGRFLEVMSRILEVDVDELGDLAGEASQIASISSQCTVFAESEVISLLSQGELIPNIVAGIHQSVARRVATLAHRVPVNQPVLFDGGTALNRGMVNALSGELAVDVIVPDKPQMITAIGAALIARDMHTQHSVSGESYDA